MKKLFYFAAAAVALAACAKNEVIPVNSGENQEITFNVAPKTKADPQTQPGEFSTDNVFASWAYYLPKDKTWNANWKEAVEYIGTEYVGSTISFKSNVWKDQTTSYYWPKDGSLTFFAYSLNSKKLAETVGECFFYCEKEEASTKVSNDQYGISGILNLDAHPNTDFLVADIAYDKKANEDKYNFTGVPTLFRHRLSRVQFAVKKNADYANTKITLNSITFNHLSCGMTYTQFLKDSEGNFSESIIPATNYKSQEYTNTDFDVTSRDFVAVPEAKEVSYIYIPQNFKSENTTATINVTYTVTYKTGISETYTKTINVKDIFDSWEMGKKYTFNLIFSLNEITWAPAVEEWAPVTKEIEIK